MNGGGYYAKRGEEFEAEFVSWQWLRLLIGQVHEVQWEPKGDDEAGVDVWTRHGDKRTFYQCKTRTSPNWKVAELAQIVAPGLQHLARSGGASEFYLVDDNIARLPSELTHWVNECGLDLENAKARELARRALGRELDPTDSPILARCRLLRIARPLLRSQRDDLASALTTNPRGLLDGLSALRTTAVLCKSHDSASLRSLLPADLPWKTLVSPTLQDLAFEESRRFVEDTLDSARPAIERAETQQLLDALRVAAPAPVLLHGAAGSGKSHILARAVQELSGYGSQVLAFSATAIGRIREAQLTPERLAACWSMVSARIVVIDQLDQVARLAGGDAASERSVHSYLRDCHRRGFTTIVGSRTADAEHATALRFAIEPAAPEVGLRAIAVGPLPEAAVVERLSKLGMAHWDLSSPLRTLARNPLTLRLIEDLTGAGGWRDARTLHELIPRWRDAILGQDAPARAALDHLLDQLEDHGRCSLDPLLVAGQHKSAMDRLVQHGVVVRDRTNLRPFHQVLLDVHVAEKLGGFATAEDVLRVLGAREHQGLRTAIYVRRALPLWMAQGARGAQLLDQLYRSGALRPLVRHALLLGLADVDDEPGPALADVVMGWLAEPAENRRIGRLVLHGRGRWVAAVQTWVADHWSRGSEWDREWLLILLASVSDTEGDLVAELLVAWSREDAGVLARAWEAFPQSLQDDSDQLFALRVGDPVAFRSSHPSIDWKALAGADPLRAVRAFAAIFAATTTEELLETQCSQRREWPTSDCLAEVTRAAPGELWASVRRHWGDLRVPSVAGVRATETDSESPMIQVAAEILARDLCHKLDGQSKPDAPLVWRELIEMFPSPLRAIDAWLLFAATAHLKTRDLAEDAWHWIMDDRPVSALCPGQQGCPAANTIARSALMSLRRLVSSETWSSIASSMETPSEDSVYADSEAGLLPVTSGYDEADLARWTTDEWIAELLHLDPNGRGGWTLHGDEYRERGGQFLGLHLRERVAADPRGSLSLAHSILDAAPPVGSVVYPYMIEGICRIDPGPGIVSTQGRLPLEDSFVQELLLHDQVLGSDRVALDLARIVEERASFAWHPDVLERLYAVARGGLHQEQRWNGVTSRMDINRALAATPSSAAMNALGCVARAQESLRDLALNFAFEKSGDAAAFRSLAAARLAVGLAEHDMGRALDVIFRACVSPAVAAHPTGMQMLLYAWDQPHTSAEQRSRIVQIAEELCTSNDEEAQHSGGRLATALRWRDADKDLWLSRVLASSSAARQGATEVIGYALRSHASAPWMYERLLLLADDLDPDVVQRAVSEAASIPYGDGQLTDSWVVSLTKTRAGLHAAEAVIELAERLGKPDAGRALVFAFAQQLVEQARRDERLERGRCHSIPWVSDSLALIVERGALDESQRSAEQAKALELWEALLELLPWYMEGRTRSFME